MSVTFNLPDLGEGLPEAEIVSWHVEAGQCVEVDQPLLSVETAKAVVDVLNLSDEQTATAFKAAAYDPRIIVSILKDVFSSVVVRIGEVLKSLDFTADETIQALHDQQIPPTAAELAVVLKNVFLSTAYDAARTLRDVGLTIDAIREALSSAGYSFFEILDAVRQLGN